MRENRNLTFVRKSGNSPGDCDVGAAMNQRLDANRSSRRDRRDPLQASLDGTGLSLF
jgi:hypothetical protein